MEKQLYPVIVTPPERSARNHGQRETKEARRAYVPLFSGTRRYPKETLLPLYRVCPYPFSTHKKSKRPGKLSESRWSPPPMDTGNPRRINSAVPASRVGIGYLMKWSAVV
ncbi:hypothetical protein EVAR_18191_1 [Eumeta japonica]|uniref:Uncharacterized protein n=1 Tax=Eumeta variegata TaxID=151549 RepID=A0A4C1UWM5_EUMVA|nr:hypothetical protein EVAR_18191_1 [Eumeta japonica]